jgi:hypothetical protein
VPDKRVPVVALLAAAALSAAASDWHRFVAESDRSSNPMIIELLAGSDTADRLDIVSALGERKDPYVEDIIQGICLGFDSRADFQREYLLRTLLGSLLDSSLPSDVLADRAAANRDELERLIRGMDGMHDPLLRNELIQIMELLPVELIMCVSQQFAAVLGEIKAFRGETGLEDRALLLTLLSYAARHPRVEFLQPCLETARTSRDALVVENARTAAKIIVEEMR